jgi:hypothetical protein
MAVDTQQRLEHSEDIRKIAAAYTDASTVPVVVGDLVRAGMAEADVMIMNPWPVNHPRGDRWMFLDHPIQVAFFSAIILGLVSSVSALLWGNPERWMIYGLLGVVLGAVGSSLAGALAATSPPHWDELLLGDHLGAVTVEVNTTDETSADVARLVMTRHDPALVEAWTEPGPRPPSEHLLWQHEEGRSPLEELRSWAETERAAKGPDPRRGRHLEVDRAGG